MHSSKQDIIPVEGTGTLDGLFLERVHRSPQALAYHDYERAQGGWRQWRWQEVAREVACWQQALEGESLSPGDRVAVLLRNCTEWVIFDQAALGLGLVVVPLYTEDRPDNIAYILKDAGVRLLLVQDAGRWRRLEPSIDADGGLQRVVILRPAREGEDPSVGDALLRMAADWLPTDAGAPRNRAGDPHQLASIVYTSGTTGRPKGVMLSHHNMFSIAHAALGVVDCYADDTFLSFLPLSHTLERTGGYYLPMMAGAAVGFSRSVNQLADDLLAIRPTVLIAVPRIFEKLYGRIQEQMRCRSFLARTIFRAAVKVGWLRFENGQGRAGWRPSLLLWPVFRKLIADKIMDRLGGRLRIAVSGGAAIPREVARTFIGLGIPLLQGYGLTETSPVVSVNLLDNNDPDSVGPPLKGVEVSIGPDDELLVRGPGVMLGYWHNEEATREMIDQDGWLHTGDQARLAEGRVYITGRIKDILVLSNGEKIPPGDMELAISVDPLIAQALVIGEGRSYLAALVVLDPDHWHEFAAARHLDPDDDSSLDDEKVRSAVVVRIRQALKDFPGHAKIRQVRLLTEPWTVENGLLTPTMKVKRARVVQQYADLIDELYRAGITSRTRKV